MKDKILETVIERLDYKFLKDVLVKPLTPTMINKEFTEQIPTGEVDEDGYNKYDIKSEVKEVESDWRKGVVLAMPPVADNFDYGFTIGDTVVFNGRTIDFDLFKDSKLIKPYDVIAVCK